MADHEYRDAYFANPKLIEPELVSFLDHLADDVGRQLKVATTSETIIGLIGTASLFGLGDQVKVSALVERVEETVEGRLLVFFPGEVEGNNYRLLGARDGWNYHATLITCDRGAAL